MVTPFLKNFNIGELNDNVYTGGSLYVFPSASRDITNTFVSSEYDMRFSHFACLNLPVIKNGTFDGKTKGLYLNNNLGYKITSWTPDNQNKAIVEHLQNYVMNFESCILNGDNGHDYDNSVLTSVSEKVFFNWLIKVGGIVFNGNEEEYDKLEDRTIQYIGNIDITNSVEVNGDSFEELYLHIPSTDGSSSEVYFRSGSETDNKNYVVSRNYPLLDKEYISGRNGMTHPYGLSLKPLYDEEDGEKQYISDSGHTIDFRDSSYDSGNGISNMNAKSVSDFTFNAVLIYYDMYKKDEHSSNTLTSTNLYGILFLNGAKFIDTTGSNKDGLGIKGYFESYPKYKETSYKSGNSYSLKIDMKVDTNPDIATIGSTIPVDEYDDPNSVISISDNNKILVKLQKCIDIFYRQQSEINDLQDRVNYLESLIFGIDYIPDMRKEISNIYDIMNTNSNFDISSLQDLIDENSKKINAIVKGEMNTKLQFDASVLKAGSGISIKSEDENNIYISNNNAYHISTLYTDYIQETECSSDNRIDLYDDKNPGLNKNLYTQLGNGQNVGILYLTNNGMSNGNIIVNIADDDVQWTKGQSFHILLDVINCVTEEPDYIEYDTENSYKFTIKTNVLSSEINSQYTRQITISGTEISGKTSIELICIDVDDSETSVEDKYKFAYLIR